MTYPNAHEKFGSLSFGAEVAADMMLWILLRVDSRFNRRKIGDMLKQNAPSSVVRPVTSCSSKCGCY